MAMGKDQNPRNCNYCWSPSAEPSEPLPKKIDLWRSTPNYLPTRITEGNQNQTKVDGSTYKEVVQKHYTMETVKATGFIWKLVAPEVS